MQYWEGLARHDDANALADELGATLRRLTPPTAQDKAVAGPRSSAWCPGRL